MQCLVRFVGVLLLASLPGLALAQTASPASAPSGAPAKVGELLQLLDDPSVKSWLEAQRTAAASAASPAPSAIAEPKAVSMADRLGQRMDTLEKHLETVLNAIPTLPAELRGAYNRIQTELRGAGFLKIFVLVAGFMLLGFGLEALFRRFTTRLRLAAAERPATTLGQRLKSIGLRLAIGLASVAVFGIGSIGAFLIFAWPPVLRELVLAYLVAVLFLRLVIVVCRVLLVPRARDSEDPDRHRVIPTSTETAQFWDRRIAILAGYVLICLATLDLLILLGLTPAGRMAAGHILGIGLILIGLEIIWRRPREASADGHDRHRSLAVRALLSAYLVLVGGLWFVGAVGLVALLLVALFLPLALSITQSAVTHLLRTEPEPEPVPEAALDGDEAAPPAPSAATDGIGGVFLERGLRVLIILGAVVLLAWAWDIDLIALTRGGESLGMRIARSALSIVVILLLADLFWQLLKALIDRQLAATAAAPGTEMAIRQARLRTLLPILRNIALVVIASLAVLMTLSELGVEIGPLIAGAGVVGVAVGFGAQTIVKDIISGIFYLLDDAFRVGEYIQSGKYQGTVESFSLRSVRLRAPRGPVFTVPFGELGAIENLSRDWAIDKFQIGVTYDTDLEKARKLIRKVGEQLKADPEMGPKIIEPLKMQGVQEFGSYAIQLRVKQTTRPGEQFGIRRKAYAMIKKAFDENGISFAFPTVQVAGGEGGAKPAVANQLLEMMKPAPAPAAE